MLLLVKNRGWGTIWMPKPLFFSNSNILLLYFIFAVPESTYQLSLMYCCVVGFRWSWKLVCICLWHIVYLTLYIVHVRLRRMKSWCLTFHNGIKSKKEQFWDFVNIYFKNIEFSWLFCHFLIITFLIALGIFLGFYPLYIYVHSSCVYVYWAKSCGLSNYLREYIWTSAVPIKRIPTI